jgi:hypothetical protein
MLCCTFAASLFSQLVVALAGVWQFVFGTSTRRGDTAMASSAVVEWQIGDV